MTTYLGELAAALEGRYRLERELGAGGMATVYLAEDLKHHRKVALKVLRPELSASLGPDRFIREITTAAGLSHPHILPLYDSGETAGFLYYVMPFVEGQSLRQKLVREGEQPVTEAIRILRDIADAMAYAHQHGVVHRDIKPENVMLSGRHALVTDFGVAKAVSEATGRQTLTTAGVALGTPAYMAPEQAMADPHVDHRADIYAWGVVAYELLAGRRPFDRATPQAMLAAQVTEAADPVAKYRGSISPSLATLVMRALEKRPADRWQHAEDLVTQLETLLTPSGGMTPTATQPLTAATIPATGAHATRRQSWRVPALLIALLVAGTAVYWFLRRTPAITPGLVVVAPFENRTGDPALDRLGLELAERVTLALAGSGVAEPFPAARLRELLGSISAGSPALARRLAKQTGAGLVIAGSYGGRTGALEVRAELLRMPAGRQVSLIEATTGPEGTALSDTVGERLAVAVAANADWGDQFGWGTRYRLARTLSAYRASVEADAAWARRDPGTVGAIRRALSADPGWPRALTGLAVYSGSDSLFGDLKSRATTWLPGDRAYLDLEAAWKSQDLEPFYQATLSLMAGDTLSWLPLGVYAAYYTNRLGEAVRLGARRNEASYWTVRPHRIGVQYELVSALHGLGRDQEALEVALEFRRLFPEDPIAGVTLEFTALAGLGQTAEVERLVAEAEGLRPDSVSALHVSTSRAIIAAQELHAHGQPEAAKRVALRGVTWFRQALERKPDDAELLDGLGDALLAAREWEQLVALGHRLAALRPRAPYGFGALYYQVEGYAGMGKRDSARVVLGQTSCCLEGLEPGWAAYLLSSALISLGDTLAAMDSFRSSWEAGFGQARAYHTRHRTVGVALKDYPAFVQLTRPRD